MTTPILHVVGARPQLVKVAAVLRAAREPSRHRIVHTGQHYDPALSDVFFAELGLPAPFAHLGIGGGTHGAQTGAMLAALDVLMRGVPDARCVVYGDTNSTLAGALAAAKLGVPLYHVEAGLRSFDRRMPEEINRVVADQVSDLLLCPTPTAVTQLEREGLGARARLVGDVMLDLFLVEAAQARETPLGRFLAGLPASGTLPFDPPPCLRTGYALATLHRAGNTDDTRILGRLVAALGRLPLPVVWPMHPRTRDALARCGLTVGPNVHVLPPQGYREFTALLLAATAVLTDSGGVQKEAWFAGRPCATLRDTTEWPETLADGWNVLVGDDEAALAAALARPAPHAPPQLGLYGGGNAAARCVALIEGPTAP